MASPHATGVAALIVSRFGTLAGPNDATMQPGRVAAYLQQSADPQPTVDGRAYLSFLGLNDLQVQTCQGGPGHNSWYGSGQVNALSAIG